MVLVTAPAPTANVIFATTMGEWNGVLGQTLKSVPVGPGTVCGLITTIAAQACATLTTSTAGQATVQVYDPANTTLTDTITVGVTAVTAYSITLQAAPTVVAKSTGTTTGFSTLTATVLDAAGQPVGNKPIAFSMTNTTGGGESVSPVVAYTAAVAGNGLGLGQVTATFTSGSLPSTADGVQVRATVVGTIVATEANLPTPTDATPSGNDAKIVIGGTAGSIAFGIATKIEISSDNTYYIQPMSVLVADVNGNPAPLGTVVNLSIWPIAWSTGSGCAYDYDYDSKHGTFLNEDANENVTLDDLEDGTRKYYASGSTLVTSCIPDAAPATTCTPTTVTSAAGTKDGKITPLNSAAGTLPALVTTDANGVASFNLTYLKSSAIWTVDRIRATTVVQGTEAVSQTIFRLPAAEVDVDPKCFLRSPYKF